MIHISENILNLVNEYLESVKVDHGKVLKSNDDMYLPDTLDKSDMYLKDDTVKDLKAVQRGKAAQLPNARVSRSKSNAKRDIYAD